jgi:Rrf2 family protein
MVYVALNAPAGPTSRREIAERQGISPDYTAQLFRTLVRAGIARGVRGPGGGYALRRDASEITAGDVLRAVEGPLALAPCDGVGGNAACEQAGNCVTQEVWRRLSDAMADVLDSITLEDLCERARQLQENADARSDAS